MTLTVCAGVFVGVACQTHWVLASAATLLACQQAVPILRIQRGLIAKRLRTEQDSFLRGITFELSGRQRQDRSEERRVGKECA